jgi:hypothetical protein
MANEAVPIELLGNNKAGEQISYNCAADTDITRGAVLKLSADRTGILADGEGDIFIGIASMDKDGDESSTTISVWTKGIFEMAASGSISRGDTCITFGDNYVGSSNAVTDGAKIVGYAVDEASSGKVAVAVGIY